MTKQAQSWAGVIEQKSVLAQRIEGARATAAGARPAAAEVDLLDQFSAQLSAASALNQGWNVAATSRAVDAAEQTAHTLVASDGRRRAADTAVVVQAAQAVQDAKAAEEAKAAQEVANQIAAASATSGDTAATPTASNAKPAAKPKAPAKPKATTKPKAPAALKPIPKATTEATPAATPEAVPAAQPAPAPAAANAATAATAATQPNEAPATEPVAEPATKPVAAAPAETPAQPKEQPAATRTIRWSTYIANSGTQAAVDACAGGLTRWTQNLQGRPYLPIHRTCGGAVILNLRVGDLVKISGGGLDGVWRVVSAQVVPKYNTPSTVAAAVGGDAILQTCYQSAQSRLVGIVRN